MSTNRHSRHLCSAVAAALLTSLTATAQTIPTADQLFNWAEGTYSTVFPAGPTSQFIATYTVRAYSTGNYLVWPTVGCMCWPRYQQPVLI